MIVLGEERYGNKTREELQMLQRHVIQAWKESDYAAERMPAVWDRVQEADPDFVRVALGGGAGESQQEPGCIVVDTYDSQISRAEMLRTTGETREVDILHDYAFGVPFEGSAVDELYLVDRLQRIPSTGRPAFAREVGRILVPGGAIVIEDTAAQVEDILPVLEDHGFVLEDTKYLNARRQVKLLKGDAAVEDPKIRRETLFGRRIPESPY